MEQTAQQKQENALRLDKEFFTPALQEATQKAQKAGFELPDILNGVAAAYTNMLSILLGSPKQAAEMLRGQSDHLKQLLQESEAAKK